jgi:hypothetical protein
LDEVIMKKLLRGLLGLHDIEVHGSTHVGTFQKAFEESFGAKIQLYKSRHTGTGAKRADSKATLASVADKAVEQITIRKNQSVGDIESIFADGMGIGVQIFMPDGKALAPNDMKLKEVAAA